MSACAAFASLGLVSNGLAQQVYTWVGQGTIPSWDDGGNWSGGVVPPDGSIVIFDSGISSGSPTLTQAHSVSFFEFVTSDSFSIGGFLGTNITISAGMTRAASTSGVQLITIPVVESSSLEWNISGTGALIIDNAVKETGGSRGFTKTGSGTLQFGEGENSAESWTGPTNINDGTLILAKNFRVNALPNDVHLNGGNLVIQSGEQIPDSSSIIMGSASLYLAGGTSETVGGLVGTSSSVVNLGDGAVFATNQSGSTTFGGVFKSDGTPYFWHTGSGTIVLGSGSTDTASNVAMHNQFFGNVILDKATNTNALAGDIDVQGGNIILRRSEQISNSTDISFAFGNLILNGFSETIRSATGFGGIQLGSGTIAFAPSAGTDCGLDIDGTSGSLVMAGTGTLVLDSFDANTYTGATYADSGVLALGKSAGVNAVGGNVVIRGGILRLDASEQIPDTASLSINSGTFFVNGMSETIGGLNGSGSIKLDGGTLTVNEPGDETYSGIITGTGSLEKSGTGVLKITGANSYTATTTIDDGTLLLGKNAQTPIFDSKSGGADIRGGQLILDYTGGTDPVAQVRSLLKTGYGLSTKFGSGQIRTSNTPDSRKGIGMDDAKGNFEVKIAYTWYGDANLDGTVNSADFTALATHFNDATIATAGSPLWSEGDFNYDGKINALDFNMLATNFGETSSPPQLGTVVPEPTLATAVIAALCVKRRRRR